MKTKKMQTKKVKQKLDVVAIISLIVIGLYCFSLLYVLAWGLLNSLKNDVDMLGIGGVGGLVAPNMFGLPRKGGIGTIKFGWHFENYVKAFEMVEIRIETVKIKKTVKLDEMMLNSLIYSVSMSIFGVVTPLLVSYACAKYNFKLRGLIYNVAVFVMLIPIVGSLSSELAIQKTLGLENLLGVCIMKNKYTGLYFLIFYAMFQGIPWTYAEAAQLDGAGDFQIFFRIMIPLAKNTIIAVFILLFIQNWNEYYTPMMFLPYMPTVAYGMNRLTVQGSPNQYATVPIILAASMLVALPVIVLYITFRNQIIGNVTMGGLKG